MPPLSLLSLSLGLDTMVTVHRPPMTCCIQESCIVYLATGQLQCDCDIWRVGASLLLAMCCWCQCAACSPQLTLIDCVVNSSTHSELGSWWLRITLIDCVVNSSTHLELGSWWLRKLANLSLDLEGKAGHDPKGSSDYSASDSVSLRLCGGAACKQTAYKSWKE